MDALFHPTTEPTATKELATVPAPSTAFKPPSMVSQSGSTMLRPSGPFGRKSPSKVPAIKDTRDNASRTTRPFTTLSSTSTHPLPPVASPTIDAHLRPLNTDPDTGPPPCPPSYSSHGAIAPSLPPTLPHPKSLLSNVVHQSPSILASKCQQTEEPVLAKASTARNTADQPVLRPMTNIMPLTSLAGAKRRLGMGPSGAGYVSKRKKGMN